MDVAYLVKVGRIYRIKDWFYLLGICAFAFVDYSHLLTIHNILLALVYSSVYLAYGYSFNNCFDTHEDSFTKNAFRNDEFGSKQKCLYIFIPMIVLLLFSAFTHLVGEILFLYTLNYLYSVPPFRWKNNLFFSLIANGIFFSYIYYATTKIIGHGAIPLQSPFLFYIFCLFIPLQFVHYAEDAVVLPQVYKNHPLLTLAVSFLPLSLCVLCLNSFSVLERAATVLFLGLVIVVMYRPNIRTARKRLKYGALILGTSIFIGRIYVKFKIHY